MKKILMLLMCLFSLGKVFGFQQPDDFDRLKPEFDSQFKGTANLEDIRKLREFISKKDLEYIGVEKQLKAARDSAVKTYLFEKPYIQDSIKFIKNYKEAILFTNKKLTDDTLLSDFLTKYGTSNNDLISDLASRYRDSKSYKIKSALNGAKLDFDQIVSLKRLEAIGKANLKVIDQDRQLAVESVQHIYDVNSALNQTKLYISIVYSGIIVLLLGFFFYYLLKISTNKQIPPDSDVARMFLSGNGLQFIALFALIISIVLFGVLGVLEGKELAAILSGISGFILGKGTNKENKNKTTSRPANGVQNPHE